MRLFDNDRHITIGSGVLFELNQQQNGTVSTYLQNSPVAQSLSVRHPSSPWEHL